MEPIAGAEQTAHVVWVSEEARIASFHPVEGYVPQNFRDHAFFMRYLHSLQRRSFRFQ
jgi:hypothetical protein